MDWTLLFIAIAALSPAALAIFTWNRTLSKDLAESRRELSDFKVHAAGIFATQENLQRQVEKLETAIEHLRRQIGALGVGSDK